MDLRNNLGQWSRDTSLYSEDLIRSVHHRRKTKRYRSGADPGSSNSGRARWQRLPREIESREDGLHAESDEEWKSSFEACRRSSKLRWAFMEMKERGKMKAATRY
jgi:hypothetical protein